jgi:hypothetical protein
LNTISLFKHNSSTKNQETAKKIIEATKRKKTTINRQEKGKKNHRKVKKVKKHGRKNGTKSKKQTRQYKNCCEFFFNKIYEKI